MQKTVDKCVGCADGCHGCGLDRVLAVVCDECETECGQTYWHQRGDHEEQLCMNCAVERAKREFSEMPDREKLICMDYEEARQ